jgi:hypothetical protein
MKTIKVPLKTVVGLTTHDPKHVRKIETSLRIINISNKYTTKYLYVYCQGGTVPYIFPLIGISL